MTFEHRVGDLFAQSDLEALGQGVNCVGAMRSGIAAEFHRRFPEMEMKYRQLCKRGELQLGMVWPWWDSQENIWVFNMASQFKPGADARLEAVGETVSKVLDFAERRGIKKVGLPQIGCGIGGLSWEDEVRPLIEQLAMDHAVHLVLVTYGKA